jgi:hypothetical protein
VVLVYLIVHAVLEYMEYYLHRESSNWVKNASFLGFDALLCVVDHRREGGDCVRHLVVQGLRAIELLGDGRCVRSS